MLIYKFYITAEEDNINNLYDNDLYGEMYVFFDYLGNDLHINQNEIETEFLGVIIMMIKIKMKKIFLKKTLIYKII